MNKILPRTSFLTSPVLDGQRQGNSHCQERLLCCYPSLSFAIKGLEKKNPAVEGRETKRALASKVGVATAQVKRLVLMRVSITRKYKGAEGEVFACLGQTGLRK